MASFLNMESKQYETISNKQQFQILKIPALYKDLTKILNPISFNIPAQKWHSLVQMLFDFCFYRFIELRSTNIIYILLMKIGQVALRILANGVLYFVFFMLLNEFLSTILSANAYDESSLIGSFSAQGKTCAQLFHQKLNNLTIDSSPKIFKCPKVHCNISSSDDQALMTATFQQCAKTACWKEVPEYYQIELSEGVLYKDKYFNFVCFTFQTEDDKMIIINDKLKKSFNENCLELFVDFICKLVGSQAPAKLKTFLAIKDWPLIPMIVSSIFLYLFFGPAYDKFKDFMDTFQKKDDNAEISHTQKVEDGYKIMEYLYNLSQTNQAKQKDSKSSRQNVQEIKDLIHFMENVQHTKVKIITGNQGIGLESGIESWVKQQRNKRKDVIHCNLKNQIDCYARLGVKNGRFSTVDCILEAIIFEKDRNLASVIFTSVTMAAQSAFNFIFEFLQYEVIKVFTLTFIMAILTMVQDPLADFFSRLPIIQWIHAYGLIAIGYVAASVLVVYLLMEYAFKLEVDPQVSKQVGRMFLDNDDPDNKTIVLIDNIQMIYPELNDKDGKDIEEFLLKCQHAQQMKKYDIILVSRHANFTKAILNKDEYLLTEVKYDDHNVSRLSFKSVRQVVDFRMTNQKGGAAAKKFGNIFAFFIDNTETLFQAMRKVKLDKKYNKDDFLFKQLNSPSKQQLTKFKEEQKAKRKQAYLQMGQILSPEQQKRLASDFQESKKSKALSSVMQQINQILKSARVRLITVLDASTYARYMKKNHHNREEYLSKENENKITYEEEFKEYHNILLNKIVDVTIFKRIPAESKYDPREQMKSRIDHLMKTEIKCQQFQGLFKLIKFEGINIQINIKGVQKGQADIMTFPLSNADLKETIKKAGDKGNHQQDVKKDESNPQITDFKNHLVLKFLYNWYKSWQKSPNQSQYEFLIQQFHPQKQSIRNIINYLNRKKVFYFYNFSSSVYALAYFMIIAKIDQIKFDQKQLFQLVK